VSTVYPRPSLPVLISRVITGIQAAVPGTTAPLPIGVITAIGAVLGRELASEYAYLDNFARWFFVATSEGIYLDAKGNPLGVFRQPASPAAGNVTFYGVPSSTVPAGALLATQDGTQTYQLTAAVTLNGSGTATGAVIGTQGGTASNQAAATNLVLSVGVAGVNAQVPVAAGGLVGGVNEESDAAYQLRILARQQLPPQGGAKRDYVAWAKLVPGVTRVWVYPTNRGAGTVDYAFVFDGRAAGGGSILPTSADNTAVAAQMAIYQPADIAPGGVAPLTLTEDAIAVTISNLVPQAGFTKAQALANATVSLTNLFAATTPGNAPYGDGIPQGGTGGTTQLQAISDAITQSIGVGSFDLTAPSADVVSATGHLAVLGAVTAP
jgi:uncharacterized phage protein gp47/JayE